MTFNIIKVPIAQQPKNTNYSLTPEQAEQFGFLKPEFDFIPEE